MSSSWTIPLSPFPIQINSHPLAKKIVFTLGNRIIVQSGHYKTYWAHHRQKSKEPPPVIKYILIKLLDYILLICTLSRSWQFHPKCANQVCLDNFPPPLSGILFRFASITVVGWLAYLDGFGLDELYTFRLRDSILCASYELIQFELISSSSLLVGIISTR